MTSLLFAIVLSTSGQTAAWTCDAAWYDDGASCDCGCGEADPDCDDATHFDACDRSGCGAGDVPWEHEVSSCMQSTCGDGWKADDEACDDFDALDSGGCSADCSAVTDGATCGERAAGCTGGGEGEGENEDGHEDDGHTHDEEPSCAAAPGAAPFALLALLRRRRR